jgi:site-specific recombinase XerD
VLKSKALNRGNPVMASKKRRRKPGIGVSVILLEDEKKKLLDYLKATSTSLKGKQTWLIVDVLLNTGIRARELCNLRLCHTPLVLGVNVIAVYRGKNDKDRDVPISSRLAEAIAEYIREIRSKTLPRHVRKKDMTAWLFYSQWRRKFTPNGLYRKVRRAGEKAGILKRCRPHVLRHTYGTNAVSRMDIHSLKEVMGHSDIRTTERYLHIVGDRLLGLAEQIDQT